MILAEKSGGRRELVKVIEAWLNGVLREASDTRAEVREGFSGWMMIAPDNDLIKTIIQLETRLDPIASGKPPYTARIQSLTDSRLIIEYPNPDGKTVKKILSTRSFAAGLGYDGNDPAEFLEHVGIFEDAPVSLAAGMPSMIQLELFIKQVLRGLDRIMILNAAISEVNEVSNKIEGLIAYHEHLTLSAHMLYLRLGVKLDKLVERLWREMPGGVIIKPLPWNQLSKLLESNNVSLESFPASIWLGVGS